MREARCGECGATVDPGRTCRDHFDALLALEWEIPGGPGEFAHFYAVASYGLQHPSSMGYTVETRDALRSAVNDALAGSATMDALRQRARSGAKERGRITRRAGDAEAEWGISSWPINVTDMLSSPRDAKQYGDRVATWARSIIEKLDAGDR